MIQAIGRSEFEDGLRLGSPLEVLCDYFSVRTNLLVSCVRQTVSGLRPVALGEARKNPD